MWIPAAGESIGVAPAKVSEPKNDEDEYHLVTPHPGGGITLTLYWSEDAAVVGTLIAKLPEASESPFLGVLHPQAWKTET